MPVRLPSERDALEILDENEDLFERLDIAAEMLRVAGAFAVTHLGMSREISFQELVEVVQFIQDVDLGDFTEEQEQEVVDEETGEIRTVRDRALVDAAMSDAEAAESAIVQQLKKLGFEVLSGAELQGALRGVETPTPLSSSEEELLRRPLGARDLFLGLGERCENPSCHYCVEGQLTPANVRARMLEALHTAHGRSLPLDEQARLRTILEDPNTTFKIVPDGVIVRGGPLGTCQGLN